MGHLITHKINVLLHNRVLVFWTLAFPILLGVLFKVVLGGIVGGEAFETVEVAVVNSQTYQDSPFKPVFEELSKSESATTGSDKPLLSVHTVSSLAEGKKLLNEDAVDGVVEIVEKTTTDGIPLPGAKLTIVANGIDQTILNAILDEITQRMNLVSKLTASEIETQMRAGNPMPDPVVVAADIQDTLADHGFIFNDRSPKSMDPLMVEFFSLMAMAALYGGFFSMTLMNYLQPPMGVIGRRISVAPVSKTKLIISAVAASFLVELVGMMALLAICHFLFGIDFGSNWVLTLALTAVSAVMGLSFGAAVSTLIPGGENVKIGSLIAVTMLGAVLAGMMGGTMRYVIDQNAPLVNQCNPVALITDGFYNLFFHPGFSGFGHDVLLLLVFSAVLLVASVLVLRRQRYDNL